MNTSVLKYYLNCCKPFHLNPDIEVKDITELRAEFLRERGIRGLVFDVDNAITKYHGIALDHKIAPYFRWLAGEFKSCIITNATPERREEVREMFRRDGLKMHVVDSNVRKPFQEPFTKALEYLGTVPGETAMIGDRLLTDIAGGNLAGMVTIKVAPLRRFSEPSHHMLARAFETFLLRAYQEEGHAVKTYLPRNYLYRITDSMPASF